MANYLAACGYNWVRLHNYNSGKDVMKGIGSTGFTLVPAVTRADVFGAYEVVRGD